MVPASFVAHDAAGNAYTIFTGPDAADAKMAARSIALRARLKTSDGLPVNRLEKGKYEILVDRRGALRVFQKDRVIVTTDDPDAP